MVVIDGEQIWQDFKNTCTYIGMATVVLALPMALSTYALVTGQGSINGQSLKEAGYLYSWSVFTVMFTLLELLAVSLVALGSMTVAWTLNFLYRLYQRWTVDED